VKRLTKSLSLFLIFYFTFFGIFGFPLAQEQKESEFLSRATPKYYLAPGTDNELLVKVNVWGEVLQPGIFEVPDNTDLVSLLSIAGGPTENAKLYCVKILRNHLEEEKIIEVNVKNYMKSGNYKEIPLIKPGDTVMVPKKSFFSVSKTITFVYNIAVIASAVHLFVE
jgi:hypothetical protein